MSFSIARIDAPTNEDMEAIAAPLHAFNAANAAPIRYLPVALPVLDEQGGIAGGLWGYCYFDWLYVEYIFVPEPARAAGLGSQLMHKAEAIARGHGCLGVWLDTFSFQALPFYLKLGFKEFGHIKDYPRGGSRYFLQKRLI